MTRFFRWRFREFLAVLSHLWPRPSSRPPRRILCYVAGGVGDRLMALPAMRFLRHKYPDAEFTVLWIDGYLDPAEGDYQHNCMFRTLRKTRLLWRSVRGYDLFFANAVSIYHVWAEACALASRARLRIGPVHAGARFGSVYNRPFERTKGTHETVTNALAAGWEGTDAGLAYPLDNAFLPKWSPIFPENGKKLIGIHPGSRPGIEAKRRWPPERYRALLEHFSAKANLILVGDLHERPEMDRIAEGIPHIRLMVPSRLTDLFACIAQCDLFIGNDSGPCHMAAGFGVPVVSVCGPTDPKQSRPIGKKVVVLRGTCDKEPCYLREETCDHPSCLTEISVEEVVAAAEKLVAF